MRSGERKFRFRMIEGANVDPRFRAVACFAAERCSIGALLRHAILEFSLVRVGVARSACAVFEMEWQNFIRSSAQPNFVALRAADGNVRACQNETRVLVFGYREGRTMKILHGVAILATVLVGRGGELFVMLILVAIRAGREFHFVQRVFAGGRYGICRKPRPRVFLRVGIAKWRAPSRRIATASTPPLCGIRRIRPCWPAPGTGPCEDRAYGSSRIGRMPAAF